MKMLLPTLAVGCMLFVSCKEQAAQQPDATYRMHTVAASDRVMTETYSATIRGRQDVDVFPQVGGTLTRLCVSEGESVRSGQVLFIIDQVPYRAALATATANVDAARAALATARLTYESQQMLFTEKVVSEFDLKTAENAWLTAQAQLAQAEAGELNARNNLSYTEVKSPVDGVVGMLPYRVGALVSPSMPQPLTTVSDNSEMFVYFSLTEKQLLELTRRHGSRTDALNNLPTVGLQLSDRTVYEEKGRIESISGVVDRTTGTAGLRAVFPNPKGVLYSGTSGNVLLPVQRNACLTIPRSATFEVQDRTFVYKVVDGRATSVPVIVSRIDGGKEYVVEEGLQAGDRIVAEGVGLIREGTIINEGMKNYK